MGCLADDNDTTCIKHARKRQSSRLQYTTDHPLVSGTASQNCIWKLYLKLFLEWNKSKLHSFWTEKVWTFSYFFHWVSYKRTYLLECDWKKSHINSDCLDNSAPCPNIFFLKWKIAFFKKYKLLQLILTNK